MEPIDRSSRAASGTRAATRTADEPCVVVVAEDEPDLRAALTELLEEAGYLVIPVATVARLHAVLATLTPSALVLDFHLPDGTTAEVIRALAARSAARNVILVSASTAAVAAAHDMGVPLISKPFELDVFLEAVARASGRSQTAA